MKKFALITIHLLIASILFAVACSDPVQSKLKGKWVSKDGQTKLVVTSKGFAMDSEGKVAEEYFIKDDTIYTSFEGNQPYTKFVIQKLEDKHLTLLDPDSVSIEFIR